MGISWTDRPKKSTVVIVTGCILTAMLCRLIKTSNPFMDAFLRILRPLLYTGLYFVWSLSFRKRIVHKATRYHLMGIAALMMFWIFVRSCKYMMPDEMVDALRLGWYMYYIPMLLIPAMGVLLALYMRKPEDYILPRWTYLIYIPSFLFIALVLTNDLHQLVFQFPEDVIWTGKIYSYNIGFYLLIGWDMLCTLGALMIILMKCRIQKNRKIIWMPFVAFGICLLYGIFCYLHPPFWKVISGDMTSAFCLLIAMILESCIQCGLIPSNSGHDKLFRFSNLSAQITDNRYAVYYASPNLKTVSKEVMRQTKEGPVMLEDGIRLCGAPIQGGHVLWEEDVSELQEILEELEDLKEELRDANLIEEENLKAEKRIAQLTVKNRLYDKIQQQMTRQIMLLSGFIDRYPKCQGEEEQKKLLCKIAVVGAYLKRRSNLIFITDQSPVVSVKEVSLCIEESIRNLSLYGADCSFQPCHDGVISRKAAMEIYDCFEAVVEKVLDGLTAFSSLLKLQKDNITLAMNVECREGLSDEIWQGADIEQDFDGSWVLSLVLPVGGGDV